MAETDDERRPGAQPAVVPHERDEELRWIDIFVADRRDHGDGVLAPQSIGDELFAGGGVLLGAADDQAQRRSRVAGVVRPLIPVLGEVD